MVDTCQEKKAPHVPLHCRGFCNHSPVYNQKRDHHVTTVDHSDIRGLGTACFGFVAELPRSEVVSFGIITYSHRKYEGSPDRDRASDYRLESLSCSLKIVPLFQESSRCNPAENGLFKRHVGGGGTSAAQNR